MKLDAWKYESYIIDTKNNPQTLGGLSSPKNRSRKLPWDFEPEAREVTLRLFVVVFCPVVPATSGYPHIHKHQQAGIHGYSRMSPGFCYFFMVTSKLRLFLKIQISSLRLVQPLYPQNLTNGLGLDVHKWIEFKRGHLSGKRNKK